MKGSNLEGCSWLQQEKVVGNRAQEHDNKEAREAGRGRKESALEETVKANEWRVRKALKHPGCRREIGTAWESYRESTLREEPGLG